MIITAINTVVKEKKENNKTICMRQKERDSEKKLENKKKINTYKR